jgi:serine/threonine protein kinase
MTALATRGERYGSWEFEEGAELAPGRTILRLLGGGSRYEAYLVWDERLFTMLVAKVLRPDQVEEERAIRDITLEAEALERLQHPVLVRGFGAVLDGPHPHVAMEHLEGPTLRRLIKRGGPLLLPQLLPLALNVAAAIHYMAQERMVHLDVKPENIVMGVPPRLIDLSVARSFERAARLQGTVGTDAYMAPEQCDTDAFYGRIGPPADVWGLAATLHHAVSGAVPYPRPRNARESDDRNVRFPQLHAERAPLPAGTPPELRELLDAGMAMDPADRPTAAEFAMALEPLVAAMPRKVRATRGGLYFPR